MPVTAQAPVILEPLPLKLQLSHSRCGDHVRAGQNVQQLWELENVQLHPWLTRPCGDAVKHALNIVLYVWHAEHGVDSLEKLFNGANNDFVRHVHKLCFSECLLQICVVSEGSL